MAPSMRAAAVRAPGHGRRPPPRAARPGRRRGRNVMPSRTCARPAWRALPGTPPSHRHDPDRGRAGPRRKHRRTGRAAFVARNTTVARAVRARRPPWPPSCSARRKQLARFDDAYAEVPHAPGLGHAGGKAAYQVALVTPAARTFATALRSFLAAAPAGPLEEVDGDRGP